MIGTRPSEQIEQSCPGDAVGSQHSWSWCRADRLVRLFRLRAGEAKPEGVPVCVYVCVYIHVHACGNPL